MPSGLGLLMGKSDDAHPLLVEKYIKTAISKKVLRGRGHDSLSYSVWSKEQEAEADR